MSSPGHRHRTPLVHKKPPKGSDVRSEINVTPLVDVCLVLLIIFMVVLDKLARGMEATSENPQPCDSEGHRWDLLIRSCATARAHRLRAAIRSETPTAWRCGTSSASSALSSSRGTSTCPQGHLTV